MKRERRWQHCVDHRGQGALEFLSAYFSDANRRCILVAGAGFDPRTMIGPGELVRVLGDRLTAIFLREERQAASPRIRDLAERNVAGLRDLIPNCAMEVIPIFDTDNAVVGGRNAVNSLRRHSFAAATDIVIDMSALSIGTSFPVIRYLLELSEQGDGSANVHVIVVSMPAADEQRRHVSSDTVTTVHGFDGEFRLHSQAERAKLWIPQLSVPKLGALEKIYYYTAFDDVCPILPFPSSDPRRGDVIAERFLEQIEGAWDVDARNIVYVSEDDPLDTYRVILDIEEQHRRVFEKTFNSVVVLSPVGSKVVALGSLMAAIERSLPVVYVEALKYELPMEKDTVNQESELLHVWLYGDAYPRRSGRDGA